MQRREGGRGDGERDETEEKKKGKGGGARTEREEGRRRKMTEGQVRGDKKKERHGQRNSLYILPPPDRPLLAARMLHNGISIF